MKHFFFALVSVLLTTSSIGNAAPIAIGDLKRTDVVSFTKEVLPILRRNCLACHNATEANGNLVLETPALMLKGGAAGPAIVPGKGLESLLLKVAAHLEEPVMPPEDNDVTAKSLTPQELGLIKLWIDQGAKSDGSTLLSPQRWRPLPAGPNPIYTVAVSPDGQFAACGRANQIFIYHVATGQLVTRLTDPGILSMTDDKRPGISHLDVVQSLAFNKQGDMLASGGFRTAKLWRYPRDVQLQSIAASAEVRAVAVNEDRTRAAIGGADGQVAIVSLPGESAEPVLLKGHDGEVRGLRFLSDGRVVSVSTDKSIRVWDPAEGQLVGRIDIDSEQFSVTSVDVPASDAEDGKPINTVEQLVTGGADNLIRRWHIPQHLPQALPDLPANPTVMTRSADGRLLAIANLAGAVRVLSADTLEMVHHWQAHPTAIHSLAFGRAVVEKPAKEGQTPPPTPRRVAVGGDDGAIYIWSLPEPDAQVPVEPSPAVASDAKSEPQQLRVLRGAAAPISHLAYRGDYTQLAASSNKDVTLWDLSPSEDPLAGIRRSSASEQLQKAASSVAAEQLIAISRDGKRMATTFDIEGQPAILVKDVQSGRRLHTLLGHEGDIAAIAFSDDGARVASGATDRTARVWDLASPKFPEVARFGDHDGTVTAVAFSRDGQQVLSGASDHSLKLWAVVDGQEVKDFAGHAGPIVAVSLLANNQPLSVSADKTVKVWNATTGAVVRTQTETAVITAAAVSRDGARLAVALADNSIKTYAVANGAAQVTLVAHDKPVKSMAFSADDARLVTGAENTAIIWDVGDGRLLEIVPQSKGKLTGVAFGAATQIVVADDQMSIAFPRLAYAGAARGIKQEVTDVQWHPNGQILIASDLSGAIQGVNTTTFAAAFTAAHGAPVHDLAVSADGARLASAGADKTVKLWNASTGAVVQPAQLSGFLGEVQCVDFTSDAQRILVGASMSPTQGQLLVIDLNAPAGVVEQAVVGHASPVVSCFAIGAAPAAGAASWESPRSAVSLSSDGVVLQWELLARSRMAGHTQAVTSVRSIPLQEGQPLQVLSGSLDGTVRRWDIGTGQALAQMNHGGPVHAVAVRSDGQRWASCSENKTVRLWNADNNAQVAQMSGDLRAKNLVAELTQIKNDATTKVAAAKAAVDTAEKDLPVKKTAETTAAAELDKTNKDVEAKAATLTAASTKKAMAEKLAIEAAAAAQVAAKAMAKANATAAMFASKSAEMAAIAARVKAASTAAPDNVMLAQQAAAAETAAKQAGTSAKAAEAAKAAPNAMATQTSQAAAAAATAAIALNKPFSDAASALALSQAAQRAAKQAHDIAVRDLDLATKAVPGAKKSLVDADAAVVKVEAELAVATKAEAEAQQPLLSVAFSPDNRTLATGGALGIVHTWDAESGNAVASYVGHGGPVTAVAYVDATSMLSSSTDKSAIVWDLNPNWQLERVIGDIQDPSILVDRVVGVDFSHDGRLLATAGGIPSRSGEVKIWQVADGALVHGMPEAHTDAATAVAFSPDDRLLASAAADKYIKTIDVATGEPVMQFEGHTNYVTGVAWRAGGKILASSGADNTLRIWNAETGDRIRIVTGFTKQVSAVRFIGETPFVMVATGQSFVRKYNTDNGAVQTNLSGPTDFMFCVDVTNDPNNGVVVAGGFDGQLRIWRASGPVLQTIPPPSSSSEKPAD